MHLLRIKLLLLSFTVMTAAQLSCDPLTQFEYNGECCRMCPPGTKMTTFGSCKKPDCKQCEEDRYTDTHTKEQECKRQPYCDPNKHFQMAVHKSKKERTVCQCELGFHCSSSSCITCASHKKCGPGEGAVIKGSHKQDTKCEKCPDGTFSNETSWDGDCKKWTECESGYHIQEAGTDRADVVCEASRDHIIPAIVIPIILVVILVCGVLFCYCRKGKLTHLKNNCIESCWEQNVKPTFQQQTQNEEESSIHEALPSQEESRVIPEENDDVSCLEISSDVALTDNGNFVTQEDGKKEVLSRQESQTQTFSDYSVL